MFVSSIVKVFPNLSVIVRVLFCSNSVLLSLGKVITKYFVIIIDDYTGLLNLYTVRSKSALDVYEVLNKYRAHVERWHGPIKVVRSDFGHEFENKIWLDKFFSLGITHEHGPAYLHGNVKAERSNRTIEDKLIETSELNRKYWSEVVKTASYTYNRTPNKQE